MRLEELEKTTNDGNGQNEGAVGTEEDTGILIVLTGVLVGALVRVLVLALALELATDVLHLLKGAARILNVLGALDVEGTVDLLEGGELDPRSQTY